jgi:uncharacterized phage protein gp47/JayE
LSPSYGVGVDGFDVKPFDTILAESVGRARQVFGTDLDVSSTSPIRKLLDVCAAEDSELWKSMEDLYYGNFVSTAVGQSLDLLGTDVGVTRNLRHASGEVTITLSNAAQGRTYLVPEGTRLLPASPGTSPAFHTLAEVRLSADTTRQTVSVEAFDRGPAGDVAAHEIAQVDPAALPLLALGPAKLEIANAAPTTGGDEYEDDETYRGRLIARPRNLWTLEAVRQAVLEVDGVLDALPFDALGGVDVSQSYFNLFEFGQRLFSADRRLGEPYFFDVVVAHDLARDWHNELGTGIHDLVTEAVDAVRPPGMHANVIEADHIEVGVRARIAVKAGSDSEALIAASKAAIAADVSALKLGSDVLFSQTLRAFVDQPGVVDVQHVHLRRCPPAFGRISFGAVPFGIDVVEAPVGENLEMGPTEIAIFRTDGALVDVEAVPA